MISLDGVSRSFAAGTGSTQALHGIDLDVAPGEFVAVIGRSGCGKSTLLRIVAGLLAPSQGRVLVAGSPVTRPRREISIMFQRPALLPWRSVLDNILLPVEMAGQRRSGHRDLAHQLLEMVGLAEFGRRLPHELSGGMQQRVALCRALILRPTVLLMDEPFSALDALTRAELAGELQQVHMEYTTTTIFVTHAISEAVVLADRVVVLTPRPGTVREIVDVAIPRPRSLGHTEHLDEVAEVTARLYDLLQGDPEQALDPTSGPPPRRPPRLRRSTDLYLGRY